jgi:glutamyl-tRNA synthetase
VLAAGLAELRREEAACEVLREVREGLASLEGWSEEAVTDEVRAAGTRAGVKGKGLFHPVRLALTGVRSGPDLGKVLMVQGREGALERLDRALDFLAGGGSGG